MRYGRKLVPCFAFVLLMATLNRVALPENNPQNSEIVTIDSSAPAHPFPHFWEQMFGSGRAILALRDSYRNDLREVKKVTDFKYVRFHAIFHDEVGLYSEDAQGNAAYNYSYIDQIYDGLLADGVRPFVELSFMPKKLASDPDKLHPFWYKQNISPPKDYAKWDDMIRRFVEHLVNRYGAEEVEKWYFEVWNEPNLDFWGGEPRQSTYFELYDHTARDIKAVDPRLRVGGPATAQAAWVDVMIKHCTENNISLDFVSTHAYGNDPAENILGTKENVARDELVCLAVKKVHEQIKASSKPNLPLIWSEFNASYKNETDVTDSTYMGPWMAETISRCNGSVDIMSYWTFSDVFEEQGVVKTPFYGGFGLLAEDDIPKPAFAAFALLHQLGDERIELGGASSVLATRRKDGSLEVAVWNYVSPGEAGPVKTFHLKIVGAKARQASIQRADSQHGDVRSLYKEMGSPAYPTTTQIEALRKASVLPAPETQKLNHGELTISVPPQGLALIEIK